jgi:aldehyde dehydrogenase (NAD+)
MDGGKPIKESRDFDLPMAAAHFFYHAGWADKLAYAVPGARFAPYGVVGQVIPWNFPAPDAGVEDRPGPRHG